MTPHIRPIVVILIILGLAYGDPSSAEISERMNLKGRSPTSILYLANSTLNLAERTAQEAAKATTRWHHAKELLGKYYPKSVVKMGEKMPNMDDLIYEWVQEGLHKNSKRYTKKVSDTVREESEKYGFDPVFLLAVIQNESGFNPLVRGSHGEIGLMQLLPDTAKWVSTKFNIPCENTVACLEDPVTNIKLGSAYLSYLRERFSNRSQLYLAAYNMGTGNVNRALSRQMMPHLYPSRVMTRYLTYYSKLNDELVRSGVSRKTAFKNPVQLTVYQPSPAQEHVKADTLSENSQSAVY